MVICGLRQGSLFATALATELLHHSGSKQLPEARDPAENLASYNVGAWKTALP